jgi:hypothetical protein
MIRQFRGESSNAPATASPPSPAIPALFAEQAVNVGETDITGVSITMRDGLKVSGRVEFELRTPAAPGPMGAGNSVSLIPINNAAFSGLMSTDPAMLDADGRFTTSGQASRPLHAQPRPRRRWTEYQIDHRQWPGRDERTL